MIVGVVRVGGRRWCARECTGCPDVQDRSIKTAHDAHQPDVDLEVPETRLRPCTVASAETTTRTAVPVVAVAAPTPTLPTGGGGGNGYLDSLRGMGAAELVAMLGAKSLGMFGTTNQPVNEPSNPRAAHDHRTPPQHTQAARLPSPARPPAGPPYIACSVDILTRVILIP